MRVNGEIQRKTKLCLKKAERPCWILITAIPIFALSLEKAAKNPQTNSKGKSRFCAMGWFVTLRSMKRWDLGVSTGGQELWLPGNKAGAAPAQTQCSAPTARPIGTSKGNSRILYPGNAMALLPGLRLGELGQLGQDEPVLYGT